VRAEHICKILISDAVVARSNLAQTAKMQNEFELHGRL